MEVFVATWVTLNKQKAPLLGRNQLYSEQFGYHEMKIKITMVGFVFMIKFKFTAVDSAVIR